MDYPADGQYKNTVVDASYDTFGSGAYVTVFDNKTLRDIAGKVPHDHVVVLANTERYGGSGFYNSYTLFTSDNKRSEEIFTHEFGHGFAGIGLAARYDDLCAQVRHAFGDRLSDAAARAGDDGNPAFQ